MERQLSGYEGKSALLAAQEESSKTGGKTGHEANYIRNTALLAMLNDAQKSQGDRMRVQLRQTPAGLPPSRPVAARQAPKVQEEARASPAKTAEPEDMDELRTEIVPLTLDEIEWLEEIVERNGHTGMSMTMSRMVDWANTEPPETKKKLFLVVRCRRCSAGAKGGVKRDHPIKLTGQQWQWLENVKERCRHATVGKTLRIITDFLMPLCDKDPAFEQKILRVGATPKTGRMKDAISNVDMRALAIRGGEGCADASRTPATKGEEPKPVTSGDAVAPLTLARAGA